MPAMYQPNYWGKLTQLHIPRAIGYQDRLVLGTSAIAVLVILNRDAKHSLRRPNLLFVEARVTNKTLSRLSGFSKDVVSRALRELQGANFIKISTEDRQSGEFGTSIYTICNPADGEPIMPIGRGSFLWAHKISYFTFPDCVISEQEANWSLANMSASENQLYFALCWLANIKRSGQFDTTREYLKDLAGFATKATTEKALRGLANKALLSVDGTSGSTSIAIHLFDPYVGEPLHDQTLEPEDDSANYISTATNRRVILNTGNPEAVERQVRSLLPEGSPVVSQANGNIMICCPFHPDDTPSCSVSPTQRIFHCFGCEEKGILSKLLMQLSGGSKCDVIRGMAEAEGCAIEYHMHEELADEKYRYRDSNGKLIKEVLRYTPKAFQQRRPAPGGGGWIWNLNGVKPLLYNAHRLGFANTVVLCEGEKDCDTVMALSLRDSQGGDIVATTSGSADSWKDELADGLRGKRVILMPDDDEAGARYAEQIVTSLEQRGIEYRNVRFADVGAKDVSQFLENGGSKDQLMTRMGSDWVAESAPTTIERPQVYEPA